MLTLQDRISGIIHLLTITTNIQQTLIQLLITRGTGLLGKSVKGVIIFICVFCTVPLAFPT